MKETFGQRLQRFRESQELTLEGLAERIGSTKSYVWELENKPNIRPSADLVYKLSTALKTTVGAMLGEKEPHDLPEKDQVFFRNFQQLSPETKDRLQKIMEVLDDDKDSKR